MAWNLIQISSGHKSLENFELEPDHIPVVLHQLKDYFQGRLDVGNKIGLEILSSFAAEILIDEIELTIGWDNWSGLFIMSCDAYGDAIVQEIERFINV